MPDTKGHTILVMRGPGGPSLYLDNYRIAGPKPWGGGTVLHEFAFKDKDLIAAGVTLAPRGPEDGLREAFWELLRAVEFYAAVRPQPDGVFDFTEPIARAHEAWEAALRSTPAAPKPLRSVGADRIAAERIRQFTTERYNRFHDGGRAGELAAAGAAYATDDRSLWPWSEDAWKPTPADPERQLVKAGALIAAAIDSLLREEVALRSTPAAPKEDNRE